MDEPAMSAGDGGGWGSHSNAFPLTCLFTYFCAVDQFKAFKRCCHRHWPLFTYLVAALK